jgi:hypothetical protein
VCSPPPLSHVSVLQVELQELLGVRESMDTLGILKPTLYFMINTKKYGAGTTVGDFICQVKSLAERKRPAGTKVASALSVLPEDRIIELECIGNGLIKISLNTFAAARRFLDLVTSCAVTPAASPMQWESPHELPANQMMNVSLAEKFFISAHFTEEDIEFASFMDDQVDEDFRKQNMNVTAAEMSPAAESDLKDELKTEAVEEEEWDSYTPEHMEQMAQSLVDKQTALQVQEAAKRRGQAAAAAASSSSRPDVPTVALTALSVFTRDRLPTRAAPPNVEEDLPPGFVSASKSKSKSMSKSKISVHKFSDSPAVNETGTGAGAGSDEVIDSVEAHDLRMAIAASLKDVQVEEAPRTYEHLTLAPRSTGLPSTAADTIASLDTTIGVSSSAMGGDGDGGGDGRSLKTVDSLFGSKRPGVYQAPRGQVLPPGYAVASPSINLSTAPPPPLTAPDDGYVQSQGYHNEAQGAVIESLREPIVVPQQLKQSVTYPVRYTLDRRNRRQQVQNSFSVLQNGEIDTYYRSDDEEEQEEEQEGVKEETKKNAEIA